MLQYSKGPKQCNESQHAASACYWTPTSDSGLGKIYLKTLNSIFEGLQQSESEKDIIMKTEAYLRLYSSRVFFSTTDSTTGAGRQVKRSLSVFGETPV